MDEQALPSLIVEAFVLDIQEAVAALADDEEISVVKGGKLLDNPVKLRISVTVNIGDPQAPEDWEDANVAVNIRPAIAVWAIRTQPYEIGGGESWWRRGTVDWAYFGIKTKEDQVRAREIAMVTASRIQHAMRKSPRVLALTDSFGETAIQVVNVTSRMIEGGGPSAHIWRGHMRYQVQTHQNP